MGKLKISLWSDLHLDFGYEGLAMLSLPKSDVMILAGDLAWDPELQTRGLKYLSKHYKFVLYVPGNHEFENKDIHEHRKFLSSIAIPNVYVLDDGFIDIQGVRFIGSTLWTDCGNPKHQALLDENIFKYWNIFSNGTMFGARESTEMHHKMVSYVAYQLTEARRLDLRSVIISHQAPSFSSVNVNYLSSISNEAFYTDLRDLIFLHEPEYWFHGHMHHSIRYELGQCTVLCNPLGHPVNAEYSNQKFNAGLVISM